MNNETFEAYLSEQFMKDYHGDKEHYENAFDNWLENLDNAKLIEHGNAAIADIHRRWDEADISNHV
jgi:hypothetical protein